MGGWWRLGRRSREGVWLGVWLGVGGGKGVGVCGRWGGGVEVWRL